jgi:protein-tyrosine-phosphatase
MKKLLFLCTVNRHRSVVGEFLFRKILQKRKPKLFKEIEISSAGIVTKQQKVEMKQKGIGVPRPLFGYRPMPCAIFYMQKIAGINVSEHRSREITADIANAADLIIALADNHKESVLSTYKNAHDKTVTLEELSGPIEFPESIPEEPPGLMPPTKYCVLECDHWEVTEIVIGLYKEKLDQALPEILNRLGIGKQK